MVPSVAGTSMVFGGRPSIGSTSTPLPRRGPSEKNALIERLWFSSVAFTMGERSAVLPLGLLAQVDHLAMIRIGTPASCQDILGLPLSLGRLARLRVACGDALLGRLPRGLAAR